MDPSVAKAPLYFAIGLLVLWRVYRRVKSLVGKQRLSRIRPWITVVVFPLVLVMMGWGAAMTHPERLPYLGAGIACGIGLAIVGLRKTVFEATPQGIYYTPHAHIGIALSLLFVGRVAWRVIEVTWLAADTDGHAQDFARSPATLALVGLLGGYFALYAAGLIRYRRGVLRRKREREAAASESAGTSPPRSRS